MHSPRGKGAGGKQTGKLLQYSRRWALRGSSKSCMGANEEGEVEVGFRGWTRICHVGRDILGSRESAQSIKSTRVIEEEREAGSSCVLVCMVRNQTTRPGLPG